MVALEGIASRQAIAEDLRFTSRAQASSASRLTVALSYKPRAETTFKMGSKLGLRPPDKAL